MVTMMMAMIGSPIMGRRINRSTRRPSAMEKRSVQDKSPKPGRALTTIEKQK